MSALDLTYHLERAAKHTGIKKVVKQVSEFKGIFICNIDIALKCDYLKVLKYQNLIRLRWGLNEVLPSHSELKECLSMTNYTPSVVSWISFEQKASYFSKQITFPKALKFILMELV